MSDAARPTGGIEPEDDGVEKRCLNCGHTDTAGKRYSEAVDGDVFHFVGCSECESPRWGSNGVRRIVRIGDSEVES